ncbi:NAD-glutamate dehydrogenase [Sphingomonas jeddahensis]|uniref:NAD-specific glutamate dehydrogenase n=1 Tax=Sphingomonas jeddahensis TaxID=1915074 RepID=A0A1V2ERX5_9SPHN|nr:NAD-glutamate dehydrogenase domain-containing protein [Sphingomonas jeddahensis]ONF95048.1 NAD-specific glutamate dehydrogenase [Sphingomonas jeddahensis]
MSKASMKALTQALADRLTKGALPGELDGFGPEEQLEAAAFLAATAQTRAPGSVAIALEPLPGDGGQRRMRLAIVNDDMPFLVDSIAGAIAAHDIAINRIIHPIVPVRRDAEGALEGVDEAGARESMIYIETDRADARDRRGLIDDLTADLADVRVAVADWRRMQATLAADAASIEDTGGDHDGAALLRWFLDRHFTLLSHERWLTDGTIDGEPLGIARNAHEPPLLAERSRRLAVDYFNSGKPAPLLLKSSLLSPVHRRVPLDLVVVPIRRGSTIAGLSIHAGLWTSAALNAPPRSVPVLRQRLADLEVKLGFDPIGHTGKALTHALATLPHDLVTAMSAEGVEDLALTAMSLADRPRPKLVLVRSALGRHLFAFVWLPRDDVATTRRVAIGDMLAEAANGSILNWSIALEDGHVALLRYTIDLRQAGVMPDVGSLDARLEKMVRGWDRGVEAALADRIAPARAARLAIRWAGTFPLNYRNVSTPEEAAEDVLRVSELADASDRAVHIYPPAPGGDHRLKIYKSHGALALSEAVPVLENFGYRVIGELPTRLRDDSDSFVHDFIVQPQGDVANIDRDVLENAITAVLKGAAENDSFNRLMLVAGLTPSAVLLYRAWFRYLRQAGLTYGLSTVADALGRAPALAKALIDRFTLAHDPVAKGDVATIDAEIAAGLDAVNAIDDDRILRAFKAVINATLRTNAFAPAAAEALAFKLDSSRIPGLPAPLPWREVWVYSPRVEGIHLRAGPVARGGLRWSDRRDDFRTEILGLMKAQRVKNAVIVPTGAKGGFYAKQLPNPATDRDAWFAEGTESYRIFIRTLLSITDNIVAGKVVHPEGVRVHDGEDPYFVVAADKGTATFSDVANAIALERGFWLGDAFASGGSQGYDHKAMGITAKGAWISVQRHFAERGVNVQSDLIRVVGCGDMSGDVFGNGMLLSQTLKIVAAFDHRHIFLDPNPDPAASWAERARLFALPRSSWEDYDKSLISAGGGVFPRSAKTIRLTPEVQAALGVSAAELEPAALISAILKAPVDLIWFGGIGTYVKAASENNAAVGDPANDRLRVDAEDLRATAVGEGANLGVTQAARIAFAGRGGRINTDFIDNSAGVDCSDNEVNIKIALNREMAEGRLGFDDRNALLGAMTDDVAHLVLEDNRLQTLALSIAERAGPRGVPSYVRAIEIFEAAGRLDRRVEGLAGNEDLLRRSAEGRGLTRPELAVLLSTAKLALQDAIETAGLGADSLLDPDLQAAFPAAMQEQFGTAIQQHQLRGEIIATKLANRIVNRIGLLSPFELAEEEGAALGDVAAMFVVVERLFDLGTLWRDIETTNMSEDGRLALFEGVARAVRSQVADLLRVVAPGTLPGEVLGRIGAGVAKLEGQTSDLLLQEARAESARMAESLAAAGAPDGLAARVVRLHEMDGAIGLVDLSAKSKTDETALTRAYTRLGEALGLDWAQAAAARLSPSDPWERLLVAGLVRDFEQMRLDFLDREAQRDPDSAVAAWLTEHQAQVARFVAVVARARQAASPSAAMLAQVANQARMLLVR